MLVSGVNIVIGGSDKDCRGRVGPKTFPSQFGLPGLQGISNYVTKMLCKITDQSNSYSERHTTNISDALNDILHDHTPPHLPSIPHPPPLPHLPSHPLRKIRF